MLVEGALRTVEISVEAVEGKIVIRSDALELRVVRRPFHYGVFDLKGKKLFVQQIGDVSDLGLVSLPMGYSRDANGRIAFHESFELQPEERLFSLEQQRGPVDRRGQRIVTWPRDGATMNSTSGTYHNTPFFWSSCGYGVFVHRSTRTTWELGFPSTITGSFSIEDAHLDYLLIFGGDPKHILARYAELSSK
jgi:alpha-glucosidase (family GH31 glycosyl hydrolase)